MIPSKRYDAANPLGISSSRLERIREWQEKLVRDERLPMTALTIVRDGKTVYECVTGYSNVEEKKPASPDTIYRMYSMTKPIVSVAIMMLFEMGRMHISDPVYLYLGEMWKKKNMSVYVPNSYDMKTGTPVPRQISPLEEGVWLMPGGSTDVEPPEFNKETHTCSS